MSEGLRPSRKALDRTIKAAVAALALHGASALPVMAQKKPENSSWAAEVVIPGPAPRKKEAIVRKDAPRFMQTSGMTEAPHGFVEMCQRLAEQCVAQNAYIGDLMKRRPASKKDMDALWVVTRKVNEEIQPATDMELYGRKEFWTLPRKRGDCEDYVLLKRWLLLQDGWDPQHLLIAVAYDENNEGHAVLIVRMSDGDYVLDNKNSEVKLWSEVPYRFVSRQSYGNPNVWMRIKDSTGE